MLSEVGSGTGVTSASVEAVVSMVIKRFPEAAETLPAASVCLAFIVAWAPEESVDEVIVTVPPAQVPVPTEVTLSKSVTTDPVTQEMVKSGVVSLVILSVEEVPESVAAVMSGVPGAASAVVSIVIERLPEAAEMLPAGSVCLAFIVA